MVIQRWLPSRTLTSWNPLREMEEMERRFDSLFGRSYFPTLRRFPMPEEGEWMPAIDVFNKDDKFTIKAEIPGMNQDDIDVAVTDSTLIIKGERKIESEVDEGDYYRCERTYGSFYRSIPLPPNVDADKIEANYEDGILEITVPKMTEAKPKKLKIEKKAKESA